MCFKCAKMTSKQNPLCELYLVFTSNWFCWISLQALFDMRLSVEFCVGVGFAELTFIDCRLENTCYNFLRICFQKISLVRVKEIVQPKMKMLNQYLLTLGPCSI